jgi:hypothetical protein
VEREIRAVKDLAEELLASASANVDGFQKTYSERTV